MISPGARDLFDTLSRHPSFQEVVAALHAPGSQKLQLSGLNVTAQCLYLTLLYKLTDRPLLVLVESGTVAERLLETVTAFFELADAPTHRGQPFLLPAHDVTPYDGLSPHPEVKEARGVGLWRLAEGSASIVIAPIGAALLKTNAPELFRTLAWRIEVGDEFFLEDLEEGLANVGYARSEPVEMVGQFSIRGGILDVYPPEAGSPFRIEMLGDQVESIRQFDPETQKSIRPVDQALLLPLSEIPLSLLASADIADSVPGREARTHGAMPPGWEFQIPAAPNRQWTIPAFLDRLVVVWSEKQNLRSQADQLWESLQAAWKERGSGLPPPESFYFDWAGFERAAAARPELELSRLSLEAGTPEIPTQKTPRFQGNITHCVREIEAQLKSGYRALVAGASLGDVERLADVFSEYGVAFQLALKEPSKASSPYLQEKAYIAGPVLSTILVQAPIREGVSFPDSRIVLYGVEDLFAASEMVARPRRRKSAAATFLSDLQDLKVGDLVVHSEHGIGRYFGITQVTHRERPEDFMILEYADRAKLYVPLARLDLIQKYHGAGGGAPVLDRMGGQTWRRTKAKVKARLKDMADELLKLYAGRKLAEGFSFSPDGTWQREFEDAFEYTETPDQITSIEDIKRDMESPHPMDRLVCGDVGFGKTEVAMRAAFKALGDGKQVAVLTPTTVLAFQHYETLRQRFAAFPVQIEMLTRFRSSKEQNETLERLATGKVDILVGTHRLLSEDVKFADLGLLIVDEEQRFGVRHKERIKQLKKNVDVLTLTATPIPRTLHMSLVGLRDISIIQTPPKDRLAVHTVVTPSSDHIIKTALQQEISRGGQAYFIHNRIESIWSVAAHLQDLLPGIRIGVGHGQMAGRELEDVMLKFMRHQYDVLVSTTIVENGLDIPLSNTILINRADMYGLSDLYQLRGRVGRSNRRAYAYLLISDEVELSDIARKRLAALKEFSELGSGFKIAALDLELRGAGNLLGAEQHGHIAAVGFETYCRMMEEMMRELQGETAEVEVRTSLKLPVDIHIPPDYIGDEAQRLQTYRRLAEIREPEDLERLAEQLKDRYGKPPQAVLNLMHYALLKSRAERLRVDVVERRANRVSVKFREDSKVDARKLMEFVAGTPGASFSPDGELRWALDTPPGPELLSALSGLMERLASQ